MNMRTQRLRFLAVCAAAGILFAPSVRVRAVSYSNTDQGGIATYRSDASMSKIEDSGTFLRWEATAGAAYYTVSCKDFAGNVLYRMTTEHCAWLDERAAGTTGLRGYQITAFREDGSRIPVEDLVIPVFRSDTPVIESIDRAPVEEAMEWTMASDSTRYPLAGGFQDIRLVGYEIQNDTDENYEASDCSEYSYHSSDDTDPSETKEIRGYAVIENLDPEEDCCTRVRAVYQMGEQKLYSPWSVSARSIAWDEEMEFAENSRIHSGYGRIYRSSVAKSQRKNITVCVNAGHGTSGGSSVKTLSHPDGTPKCTGGSTAAGETYSIAVSGGTTMLDGTPESHVTLSLAMLTKDALLEAGYDVLMIREENDMQLDNIARTVLANNYADCHIALHYNDTTSDRGAFYCAVPNISSYRSLYPVSEHYEEHLYLGDCLIDGFRDAEVKIAGSNMDIDLTQTSYSTVPSIDMEVGDRGSDLSENYQSKIADGIVRGIQYFFGY